MSKIELSLSSDYVPNWTIVDAIRELFQNALDQEVQYPDNAASWSYEDGVLQIRNKKSMLPVRSLLLGASTKAGDESTIGQFGEGYKIATLVLLRNFKTVTIYNYGAREVWRPRFVKSRRFGADVLTFFIEKHTWTKPPTDDLVVEVGGISDDEWRNHVVPSNMRLWRNNHVLHETEFGQVLDTEQRGQVFVNGLFVCTYSPYKYGYNFKAGQLRLDRDRKLASDFDLKWLASKMWSTCPGVMDLIESGADDVEYLADSYVIYNSSLADEAWDRFQLVYGLNAVPVTSQAEADAVPTGYRAVIVPSAFSRLIRQSNQYEEPVVKEGPTLKERLMAWYDTYSGQLKLQAQVDFLEILSDMEDAQ